MYGETPHPFAPALGGGVGRELGLRPGVDHFLSLGLFCVTTLYD